MYKIDLEKAEDPEIKLPISVGQRLLDHRKSKIIPEKNIYFCFIDYAKTFDYMAHNKLWKILQGMVIPSHLICLQRNLNAGHEATGRIR